MNYEYSDNNLKLIETRPLSQILMGIVLTAVGIIFLSLVSPSDIIQSLKTPSTWRLVFVTVIFPIFGILLIVSWFTMKPKIFDIYADKIIISLTRSQKVIEEVLMKEISEIVKRTIYANYRPYSKQKLSGIEYFFVKQRNPVNIRLGRNFSLSHILDKFIQSSVKIPLKVEDLII